jgi:hypothetical protein
VRSRRKRKKYSLCLPTCEEEGRKRRRKKRKEKKREKKSSIISYPKHRFTEMFFPTYLKTTWLAEHFSSPLFNNHNNTACLLALSSHGFT